MTAPTRIIEQWMVDDHHRMLSLFRQEYVRFWPGSEDLRYHPLMASNDLSEATSPVQVRNLLVRARVRELTNAPESIGDLFFGESTERQDKGIELALSLAAVVSGVPCIGDIIHDVVVLPGFDAAIFLEAESEAKARHSSAHPRTDQLDVAPHTRSGSYSLTLGAVFLGSAWSNSPLRAGQLLYHETCHQITYPLLALDSASGATPNRSKATFPSPIRQAQRGPVDALHGVVGASAEIHYHYELDALGLPTDSLHQPDPADIVQSCEKLLGAQVFGTRACRLLQQCLNVASSA